MGHLNPDPIPAVERVREQLAHHLEQTRLLKRQLRLSEAADDAADRRSQSNRTSRYRQLGGPSRGEE
jgi:hypothetical protein